MTMRDMADICGIKNLKYSREKLYYSCIGRKINWTALSQSVDASKTAISADRGCQKKEKEQLRPPI